MKKTNLLLILAITLSLFAVGCSSSNNMVETESKTNESTEKVETETSNEDSKGLLRIGTSPSTIDIGEAAKEPLEEIGYEVEVIAFDDYVLPNTALEEGALDFNVYQHTIYLEEFNKNNGTNLQKLDEVCLSLVGLYSNNYEVAGDLPEGAQIAIFQDASNQDRSLRLLEKLGEISLTNVEGLATLLDISENPKNLKFVSMDINQVVKGLDDLDAAFVTGPNLVNSRANPKYTIGIEEVSYELIDYAVAIVTSEENVNADWVEDIKKIYMLDEVKEFYINAYEGAFTPVK